MSETLVLDVARRRLLEFASKQRVAETTRDDERQECERLLKSGVDALRWIVNAESFVFEAARAKIMTVDQQVVESLRALYRDWLQSASRADAWIAALASTGGAPANQDTFRHAQRIARDAVARDAIIDATTLPLFPDEPFDLVLPIGAVRIELVRLDQPT